MKGRSSNFNIGQFPLYQAASIKLNVYPVKKRLVVFSIILLFSSEPLVDNQLPICKMEMIIPASSTIPLESRGSK